MTVSDLIARLSQYPADMPVRICADDAYIVATDPSFAVEDARPFDDPAGDEVPTLFIDIN